jgi:hypothetical protein
VPTVQQHYSFGRSMKSRKSQERPACRSRPLRQFWRHASESVNEKRKERAAKKEARATTMLDAGMRMANARGGME